MNDDDIKSIVSSFVRITVATHQRRVAIREGVRDARELFGQCSHANWNHSRAWCDDCGITLLELRIKRVES